MSLGRRSNQHGRGDIIYHGPEIMKMEGGLNNEYAMRQHVSVVEGYKERLKKINPLKGGDQDRLDLQIEMDKYNKIFESYFLKSFTSRLTDYSDPKISVLSAEKINEKYTIVKSMLVKTDKKHEVKIDWRVYTKNPENPLIRDLIIEGLSLARTQKEEFASILSSNNNDIDALFSKLEEFIKK